MQLILLNCRSEFLREILADNFYTFRKNYVIEYIEKVIEYYERDENKFGQNLLVK